MSSSFREVETAFQFLRRQFREKEISRPEFIDRLKKLRLKDSQGRFWMIGAQSGKWYFFDGRDWVASNPPSEGPALHSCPSCGLENEPDAETCAGCGERLRGEDRSAGGAAEATLDEEALLHGSRENFVLRRLNASSFFFFSGGTGLVLGLILGAFSGASGFFSGMSAYLPESLGMLKGTLMGGIVFAGLGGLLGFLLWGAIGWLQALLFNAVSALAGGFRVTLDRAPEKEKEERETS
jgi:hypothetical protein